MTEDARLVRISRELFVRAHSPSAADVLEPWVVGRMTSLLDEVDIRKGAKLFSAGEPPEIILLLREGRVQLVREGFAPWTYDGQWVLGGFEVVAERYLRTAIAMTDLHVMTFRADGWLELIEDSFDLGRGLLVNMAGAVSRLDQRLGAKPGPARPVAHVRRIPKEPLSLIERLAAMTEMTMFRGAGVQTLADVAARVEEVSFEVGQTMIERGARRERMFLVLEGDVEASRDEPGLVRGFGAGTVAGGVAAFGEHGREWALRAKTPTRALVLHVETWTDLMEEHFDLLRAALRSVAWGREQILEAIGRAEGEVILR